LELHARFAEILERGDAGRIVGRRDDHEAVVRERAFVVHPGRLVVHRFHPGLARGGEHVGRRSVVDLRRKRVRGSEDEPNRGGGVRLLEAPADLPESLRQGRRREHQHLASAVRSLIDRGRPRAGFVA
jgi:hypothetical protein